MPSVFTIQGPELFPRARKRTEGRLGQTSKKKNCFCLLDRRGERFKSRCYTTPAAAKKAGKAAFNKDKRAKEIVFGAECSEIPKTTRPATTRTRTKRKRR